MSALEKSMAGRRAAAQTAERRKKVALIALTLVFATLLAIQGPKLLKGSKSSSSAPTTSASTTANSPSAAPATTSFAVASTAASRKRIRAIRGMAAKDLFVPLIHDSTGTSSSTSSSSPSSSSSSASATPAASAPAPAAPVASAQTKPVASAQTKPVATKPAHVKPAAPNAAVIWTNGRRQVVGVSQAFAVGGTEFRLIAVTRDAIRIKVLGGAFAGRGQSIIVHRGRRVQLANTATGVGYGLLFTQAGIAAPSTNAPTN